MRLSIGAALLLLGCAGRCPEGGAASYPGASHAPAAGGVSVAGSAASGAVVAIDRDGRAWIEGQPVASDEELAARLQPGPVTVQADARVPHGRVLGIVDRLRAAGITEIAFGTATANPPAAPRAPEPPVAPPPEPKPEPAPVAGSLPRVTIENVGMHIGGGPNDDAAKQPFRQAVETQFDAFRACYVKAEEPEKGGTFGVDLFIRRDGGAPEVRQPRTGMKGAEFRQCVIRAFEQVSFAKPPRGPTVVSYSLRFKLEG